MYRFDNKRSMNLTLFLRKLRLNVDLLFFIFRVTGRVFVRGSITTTQCRSIGRIKTSLTSSGVPGQERNMGRLGSGST